MPKVSIIMGVYNGSSRVDKAITSILHQSFQDWEFLICDDGSSDDSFDVLNEFAKRDCRIKVLRNPTNLGLAKALNRCLEVANGEYVARMDDDDYSHNNRIQEEVLFLDNHPEFAIVGTGRNMIDENGIWGKDVSSGERTSIDIFKGNSFAHPTVMIRRSALDVVGGYSEYSWIGREEDTDLWCKLYTNGFKGTVIDSVLLDYYESRSSMVRRKYKYRIVETRIRLKYMRQLHIPFYYILYAFRPLLVGMVPRSIIFRVHHRRLSSTK